MIVKERENIKFILAGRDDMKGVVQEQIRKKQLEQFVDIPGFVKETKELLQASKIMVLPSLLPEGCPTSILEGMAWGLPIVCYDIKGVNELVINNKTGFIVSLNNKKKMAEMILKLIDNPKKLRNFGISVEQICSSELYFK